MHAQRCPVAKLLAASQQKQQLTGKLPSYMGSHVDTHQQKRNQGGLKAILPSKGKPRMPTKAPAPKGHTKPSFFQKLHGDGAPLLPPCPQMYSDESWSPSFSVERAIVYQKEKTIARPPPPPPPPPTCEQSLVFNENCSIHGIHAGRRGSRAYSFPKSISCPTPARLDSRQTVNAERLKNWRRNSLTIAAISGRGHGNAVAVGGHGKSTSQQVPHHHNRYRYNGQEPCSSSSLSSSPSSESSSPSTMSLVKAGIPEDLQNRRSQFRRAWTFFSIGCDELQKDKPPPQRILRQPTRYVYRRGISGLPIECTNRSMGVAF